MHCLRDDTGRASVLLPFIATFGDVPQHAAMALASFRWKTRDHPFDIAERLVDGRSGDRSRLDSAHVHSKGAQFETHVIAQDSKRALARIEQAAEGDRKVSADRGDVHDPSAFLAQGGQERLRHRDLYEHVDVEYSTRSAGDQHRFRAVVHFPAPVEVFSEIDVWKVAADSCLEVQPLTTNDKRLTTGHVRLLVRVVARSH